MNINIKRFNNFFLTFVTFILFVAIYNLYVKHSIGNDSTISEWLINYQGGFTRRGIIGEICYQITKFFNPLTIISISASYIQDTSMPSSI